MKFGTQVIHGGLKPDPSTGAVMTPIYQTSTYAQEKVGEQREFAYSRTGNPTRDALEKNLAAIENANHCACFGSGMAAIDAAIKLLSPGDEVISSQDLYGGTYRIFKGTFEKYGITFRFINLSDLGELESSISTHTKLVWVETPTNPTMQVLDLISIAEITKKHNLLLAVDNTFATPYNQRPLDLGADIVMHSATKYLGGHSDVVMGALAVNNRELAQSIYAIQNSTGAIPGPMDCFLVIRGIKTLHLRMQRHAENGECVARYLVQHKRVNRVNWPGLKSHPNYTIAERQMRTFGGMISFSLNEETLASATNVLAKFNVFALAESLGGVESLASHPATMTHAAIPKLEREKSGVTDSLIRLSVGIEDVEDLIADLEQALE